MIIEYRDTAHCEITKGDKCSCQFYFRRKRTTNIILELRHVAIANLDKNMEDIYLILQNVYKNKSCRSKCEIYFNNDFIEITNKGVFPNIIILKNEQ